LTSVGIDIAYSASPTAKIALPTQATANGAP
jgi:hypothetical protein